jgi:glutamate-1-semialdehyde 2,1-aminomutase
VPAAAVADTVVVPYNRVPDVGSDVACVIVEPLAANMGLVPPAPGFLEGLRRACDAAGALLIFDEVITGFRVAPGGVTETSGVVPDLWCFGKVIGGGLPVGAFAGRRETMEVLAPLGPVYQAGTLAGNPLATAAGLAALELLTPVSYDVLSERVAGFAGELSDVFAEAGVPARIPVVGPLMGLFFAPDPVTDYRAAQAAAAGGQYARFFHAMLARGVALAPGPYEAIFPSLAHSDEDFALTLEAAGEAAAELAGGA